MRGFHRETRSPQRSCCWKLKSYSPTCPDCGQITGNPEVMSSPVGLVPSNALVFTNIVSTPGSTQYKRAPLVE
jgi:hypothetical protein